VRDRRRLERRGGHCRCAKRLRWSAARLSDLVQNSMFTTRSGGAVSANAALAAASPRPLIPLSVERLDLKARPWSEISVSSTPQGDAVGPTYRQRGAVTMVLQLMTMFGEVGDGGRRGRWDERTETEDREDRTTSRCVESESLDCGLSLPSLFRSLDAPQIDAASPESCHSCGPD
jgi:hypothetical protein